MEEYIVDASVIVKWLNQDRELHTKKAFALLKRAALGDCRLCTADLALFEVSNALIRGKGLAGSILKTALGAFFQLPLFRHKTTEHVASVAALIAQEQKITFYDAVYLAHAHQLGVPLVTANPKDQKPMVGIRVIRIDQFS